MRKELRPVHDLVPCDVCERTILKGERIEIFVAGGERRRVCELCTFQALRMGWPREAELTSGSRERERVRPRRPLWSRVVQWAEDQGLLGSAPSRDDAHGAARPGPSREAPLAADGSSTTAAAGGSASTSSGGDEEASTFEGAEVSPPAYPAPSRSARFAEEPGREFPADGEPGGEGWAAWARRPGRTPAGGSFKELLTGRRDEPHEVHAVPTSREAKLERAFELFNASEHRRTVAGIGRALGEPWVSASPVAEAAAAHEVTIVVAWELSWYRYRVDLDDADQGVHLLDRGDELEDLDEDLRVWNAAADNAGCLALAVEPVS